MAARAGGRVGVEHGCRGRLHGAGRPAVAGMQRARLLAAVVAVVDELGYANTSVAEIVARSRVSRRTFYEQFANREECLAAALEEVVAGVEAELAAAGLEGLAWVERVRTGLGSILAFLDREPVLARVCVVQALAAGPLVLAQRERVLTRLAAAVAEGAEQSARVQGAHVQGAHVQGARVRSASVADRGAGWSSLTAEGLVGAAFAIVHARLQREQPEALSGLLGELMGMIVLPYLGAAAARREQNRPAPAPAAVSSQVRRWSGGEPLRELPMRLTYRTAMVLSCVQRNPRASNRQVAGGAGIQDPGQVSKLLNRLQRLGLLVNDAPQPLTGEPNAWSLTPAGERVVQSIPLDQHNGPGENNGPENNGREGSER